MTFNLQTSIMVVDVETNIKHTGPSSKACPFDVNNSIVYLGLSKVLYSPHLQSLNVDIYSNSSFNLLKGVMQALHVKSGEFPNILVGHNIKFDLLYLRKHAPLAYNEWYRCGGRVWDTMVVDYILSGQANKLPSLDFLSNKYGLSVKDSKIKEYWDSGVDTEDIPEHEIVPYLEQDVSNTGEIFIEQLKEATDRGLLPLIFTQMDALLALAEAEWNGMYFDRNEASKQLATLELLLQKEETELVHEMKNILPDNFSYKITPSSPKQISTILYGGNVKVNEYVDIIGDDGLPVVFKSGGRKGQKKKKKVDGVEIVGGLVRQQVITSLGLLKGKTGVYPTDDRTLQRVGLHPLVNPYTSNLITKILYVRQLQKDISTYYKQYISYAWDDGFIHSNFHQALTDTGRLSSSNPNMQNLSNKEIE